MTEQAKTEAEQRFLAQMDIVAILRMMRRHEQHAEARRHARELAAEFVTQGERNFFAFVRGDHD